MSYETIVGAVLLRPTQALYEQNNRRQTHYPHKDTSPTDALKHAHSAVNSLRSW
jgi:hypothetical protein